MTKPECWWGEFEFSPDEIKCWHIGDRSIAIKRGAHEWTVWNKETDSELNAALDVSNITSNETFKDVDFQRFMVRQTDSKLVIEPSLADRAMIARPSKPIVVMPNENITLYVSTPLWMTILLPQQEAPMADIPFWRPSDSWFGTSTMQGDICYSKYTDAKMDKNLLEKRSHRASTMVTLKNDQDEPLSIQRLNLPVPALKVYVDDQGEFWTDQVNILQRTEHSKPVSHLRHSPPEQIQLMEQVSESRELSKKPSFLSSIKNLVD